MQKLTHVKKIRRSFRISYKRKWENVRYEECSFLMSAWIGCRWEKCDFYRVGFHSGCRLHRCVFTGCRFRGQHTYLGAAFTDCRFVDCDFIDVSFGRAALKDCLITGTLTNIVFYGKEAPKTWQTVFKRVDFSGARLIDTSFRCGLRQEELIGQPGS